MLVAPASRRRWWCTDAGWFYRPRIRIRIRPLSRSLPLFRTMPSAPAFWAAVTLWRPGGPASHGQRGHSVGIGRTVTTLPARRRPAGELGEMLTALSPWSARCDNVREAPRCRRPSGAHCQTPHSRWGVFFVSCQGFGWRRRQVMARTSSKSWMAVVACAVSIAATPVRMRRWVSTSFAEP